MESLSSFRLSKAFDRDMKLLTLSMSFRRIAMGFLMIVRSIYFSLLGFSPVEIGLLLSIGTFISALHHISFGYLSDKYGRKIFLLLGGVFATLRLIIFAISNDFWMLALGQGIGAMGEGAGAGQPVVSGYIADKTTFQERGSIFGFLAITNAIAATFGSLLAGLPNYFEGTWKMNVIQSHSLLFWLGAATSAASLIMIFSINDIKPTKTNQTSRKKISKKNWEVIAKFSLVRSSSGLGWGFIESLLPLYFFLRFDVGGEVLGPIYALARFLSIFSYLLIPIIVQRYGDVIPIIASRFLTSIITIGFSIATKYWVAAILLILMRIVISFTMPIRQTFATGIVDPRETATAIGVSNFARMGFRTIAPTAAGYMFESLSPTLSFLSGATLLFINGLLYKKFFSEKDR
jgi:DHA1 family multidrug resistance protein-like MFS transporter